MRRLVLLASVLFLLLPVKTASAGGSSLDVIEGQRVRIGAWDLPYASVGSVVTMRGRFSTGQQAAVSEGPWYAYLRPFDGETSRVLLGEVDVTGDGYPYLAAVTFEVPSVAADYYSVDVCDIGCTQGVGDLVGGTVVLAPTEAEAQVFARALILQWMHDADTRTIDGLKHRQQALQAELEDARTGTRAAERRADEATERAADATKQTIDTQASLEDTKQQRNIWRLVAVVGLLALFMVCAWAVSLRRRVRVLVPDSPQWLSSEDAVAPTDQTLSK